MAVASPAEAVCHWTVVPNPQPPGNTGTLEGVVALSAADAWAVGSVQTERPGAAARRALGRHGVERSCRRPSTAGTSACCTTWRRSSPRRRLGRRDRDRPRNRRRAPADRALGRRLLDHRAGAAHGGDRGSCSPSRPPVADQRLGGRVREPSSPRDPSWRTGTARDGTSSAPPPGEMLFDVAARYSGAVWTVGTTPSASSTRCWRDAGPAGWQASDVPPRALTAITWRRPSTRGPWATGRATGRRSCSRWPLHWNGHTWAATPTPELHRSSELRGVAAISAQPGLGGRGAQLPAPAADALERKRVEWCSVRRSNGFLDDVARIPGSHQLWAVGRARPTR